MAWTNEDGLHLKFGTEKTEINKAGEYRMTSSEREIELKLTLSELTEAEVVQSDTTVVPEGARISEVEIEVEVAAATGVAIDVGLVRTDRTTEIDFNGFVNAEVTADMTAGTKITWRLANVGASAGGALIGTTLANSGYITASRTTATAFTAGVVYIRIRYYMP